jgi:hypothetical protein
MNSIKLTVLVCVMLSGMAKPSMAGEESTKLPFTPKNFGRKDPESTFKLTSNPNNPASHIRIRPVSIYNKHKNVLLASVRYTPPNNILGADTNDLGVLTKKPDGIYSYNPNKSGKPLEFLIFTPHYDHSDKTYSERAKDFHIEFNVEQPDAVIYKIVLSKYIIRFNQKRDDSGPIVYNPERVDRDHTSKNDKLCGSFWTEGTILRNGIADDIPILVLQNNNDCVSRADRPEFFALTSSAGGKVEAVQQRENNNEPPPIRIEKVSALPYMDIDLPNGLKIKSILNIPPAVVDDHNVIGYYSIRGKNTWRVRASSEAKKLSVTLDGNRCSKALEVVFNASTAVRITPSDLANQCGFALHVYAHGTLEVSEGEKVYSMLPCGDNGVNCADFQFQAPVPKKLNLSIRRLGYIPYQKDIAIDDSDYVSGSKRIPVPDADFTLAPRYIKIIVKGNKDLEKIIAEKKIIAQSKAVKLERMKDLNDVYRINFEKGFTDADVKLEISLKEKGYDIVDRSPQNNIAPSSGHKFSISINTLPYEFSISINTLPYELTGKITTWTFEIVPQTINFSGKEFDLKAMVSGRALLKRTEGFNG